MADSLSLEARIRQLEDEREIRELLVEYGRCLDARDFRGYARLFAGAGEWIGGLGRARGPAAIEAMLAEAMGPVPENFRNTSDFHILTNFQISIDGDRASARSKLIYMVRSAEGTPIPDRGGHYEDTLVREDGRWKFLRRVVMGDIPPQDPLAGQG